ncbi:MULTISPECIES: fumarylacetoacetate hydrolase family protein [Aliiglaciecola]|uniref:fumarylacetoacetate hydrolase family protein n=1 Tax=Aliiglaciecola TaxID=1406885 RepID=UPI001C0964DD|nr:MULTISPECIES: fumarylacetoacetate hydrolase family protein [Aliiglaciecola]MBU2879971.1 fumarylacetoacetate hydrolase family protein [Aliiglaciecola lipolytica]MDO6711029.1 fumarylacetoacetate hydrolase family protein [Aliiglaciecola sp. 2_MG-2023]MDO6754239.1 fumarylacetoacetate hydrolase family protein [Aliiglaciecola sp. 1_MG-2023]
MKLLRFGLKGQEAPGILDTNNEIRDLSSVVDDIDGATLQPEMLEKIRKVDLTTLPKANSDVRLGACVNRVGKFICIGLNYADHAAESKMPIPTEPEVFSKFTSAITGPNDDIIKPKNSDKLDWEVELAIVIGKKASYVPESEAADHIAGYCICNDVSERTFQLERGNQWDKGKGCDSFGPIGPYLVTSDDVTDPHNLAMWLEVNGKRFQDGNTKTMIFKPAFIVSYLSQFCTLEPGDVISTGTPPGVGLGQNPPLYLNVGDKITLGIEGLGKQSQTVIECN